MSDTEPDYPKTVRYLRALADAAHGPSGNATFTSDMHIEAATAIEALTEEKERLQGYVTDWRDKCVGLERECWETTATNVELRMALTEALKTLKQSRNFITWREKMHPDGVALYDETIVNVEAALSPQPEGQDND